MSDGLLPLLLGGAVMLSLNAYVLLGGADFGGGVWDLLASGPRRARQRALIADAIGPIWEANHVWLILVIVLLFTCFPPAFARLSVTLHIPLALMLVGIVLRGSAFTFRSYDSQRDDVQRRWGSVFAGASVVTPLLLGVAVGAIASGGVPPAPSGTFLEGYVRPWARAFPMGVGLLTVVLFAFLAAVYLTLEADDDALREDFRRRALGAGVAAFGAAALALALASGGAPLVWRELLGAWWALPLHLATGAAAIAALYALWTRRWRLARAAAVTQVSCILWGWGLAQYPYLLPPHLTLADAAAPAVTLRLVLGALVLGAFVLVPSLYYLFRVFKTRPA
ncbi:MAG TPA: cytochrome d ubiquinol oxidase subunit II [Gemmatimonadales bacterium]|nr:cytochrome d ubiquinol oxidase subunit II [Gemmatimonadales bacterium]